MIRYLFTGMIRLYRIALSPVLAGLGCRCRFYPCCSSYAEEAFQLYPWPRAVLMTAGRIARCGPWHPGGFDPVTEGVEQGLKDTGNSNAPGPSSEIPGLKCS